MVFYLDRSKLKETLFSIAHNLSFQSRCKIHQIVLSSRNKDEVKHNNGVEEKEEEEGEEEGEEEEEDEEKKGDEEEEEEVEEGHYF